MESFHCEDAGDERILNDDKLSLHSDLLEHVYSRVVIAALGDKGFRNCEV